MPSFLVVSSVWFMSFVVCITLLCCCIVCIVCCWLCSVLFCAFSFCLVSSSASFVLKKKKERKGTANGTQPRTTEETTPAYNAYNAATLHTPSIACVCAYLSHRFESRPQPTLLVSHWSPPSPLEVQSTDDATNSLPHRHALVDRHTTHCCSSMVRTGELGREGVRHVCRCVWGACLLIVCELGLHRVGWPHHPHAEHSTQHETYTQNHTLCVYLFFPLPPSL